MKALEIILNLIIRIINVLIICLTIITYICIGIVIIFILIPLEIIAVMPIYYIITGKWYFGSHAFENSKLDMWLPIAFNVETYYDNFPDLTIPEINLSKYYGRDTKH